MDKTLPSDNFTPIELLAPAKNLEAGKAAIRCGADALYIGAGKFGARASAGNTPEDIAALVEYARKFRVKVYVTLNTLLTDEELEEAGRLAHTLWNCGVDALIIQDMGLLEIDMPPIPLIASTQTNNTDWRKVLFLEQCSFKRVILARELSLREIAEIRTKTHIELEFFIHGALCVSYSGQCYMSYAIGGRSGNRGVCAQPCREQFSLIDSKGRVLVKNQHLLSLRDLSLHEYLGKLIEAGITSFKIEGRLKETPYVMNIVAFYRRLLDSILEEKNLKKSSGGVIFFDFEPDPGKTFNRGFTTYWIEGKRQNMANHLTPKSRGEYVGKVIRKEKNRIEVRTEKQVNPGDGICYFDKSCTLMGTWVTRVTGNILTLRNPGDIPEGTDIYRNYDRIFIKKLEDSKVSRKIPLRITLEHVRGDTFLKAVDDEGNEASVPWNSYGESVKKLENFINLLKTQLSKLGETDFFAESVDIRIDKLTFLTTAEINRTRRELMEKLVQAREKAGIRETRSPSGTLHPPAPWDTLDYRGNVLNRQAELFYEQCGVHYIEPAAELQKDLKNRMVMRSRYCLKYELGLCPKYSSKQEKLPFAPRTNTLPLYLKDSRNNRFQLTFNCTTCHMELYQK